MVGWEHRYMEVLVLNGYYDMATPYFATEYTFGNLLDYITRLLYLISLSYSSYRRRPIGFPFVSQPGWDLSVS